MKVFFYVFILHQFFWLNPVLVEALFEGDACQIAGTKGYCKKIPNCPFAIEAIHTRPHLIKICDFDGLTAIVCCPSMSGIMQPKSPEEGIPVRFKNERKSERACRRFSKGVKRRGIVRFNILGGTDADIDEFPHMAALGYRERDGISWNCGATLISERFLLTAAHCFIEEVVPSIVRLGVTLLDDPSRRDIPIKKETPHPLYDKDTKHHDISIVELVEGIRISKRIRPACLFQKNNDPDELVITGWGVTTNGRSNHLQKANVMAVPVKTCNDTYVQRTIGLKTITSKQICAWGNAKQDACWGDSGGAMQVTDSSGTYSVVGVISYGQSCAGQTPSVFVRVSQYLDWIEGIVWK
ncbi:serine protease Hayan isoform X1 [Leptinotarsa decemlineata]|uniref:serine protease Hayan isoform X1 n=1 Tax=Leptinotarsa decemlineata TaxID=7539 RepID=UPI003D3097C6